MLIYAGLCYNSLHFRYTPSLHYNYMIYPTIHIIFNRRKTASRYTNGSVEIDVFFNCKHNYISTGVRVLLHQWHQMYMVVNRDDAEDLNDMIRTIENRVRSMCKEMADKGEFNFASIKDSLKLSESKSFIEFCEKRISERKELAPGTLKHHLSWLNIFKSQPYIKTFADLNLRNIQQYDAWLYNRTTNKITIWSHHKRLKVYIHEAMALGYVAQDPYVGLKVERGKQNDIKYLTEEEVNTIRGLKLHGYQDRIRDLFIVQCFTGLAYADLMKTDFTKHERRGDHYVIADTRQKTNERYFIVLLKPVVEILEKYNWVLPKISNQKYNNYLRDIQEASGITTHITSHVGRHTFAVYMLSKGIAIENVAKMMGHTDIKTTQVYAKILATSVEDAYLKVDANL